MKITRLERVDSTAHADRLATSTSSLMTARLSPA
jgi:hypothetical protein